MANVTVLHDANDHLVKITHQMRKDSVFYSKEDLKLPVFSIHETVTLTLKGP